MMMKTEKCQHKLGKIISTHAEKEENENNLITFLFPFAFCLEIFVGDAGRKIRKMIFMCLLLVSFSCWFLFLVGFFFFLMFCCFS
jgi:hypothetical protein